MFEKAKLKKDIKRCKAKINFIESKRVRSQAALVEAILTHATPKDEDVEFFNKYTEQIELERKRLHDLTQML